LNTNKVSSNSINDRLEDSNVRELDDDIIENLATHAGDDHGGQDRGPAIVKDITGMDILLGLVKPEWGDDDVSKEDGDGKESTIVIEKGGDKGKKRKSDQISQGSCYRCGHIVRIDRVPPGD
jgi:hypothetical protein